MTVVIVGASLAGLRTAEALRMRGYEGNIVLVGGEPELPYDRPPLSKEHLAAGPAPEPVLLRKQEDYAVLGLELRLGVHATRLDLEAREVHTDEPDRIPFDHLVVATGGMPRRAPQAEGLGGFHVVRTVADADALRRDLDRGARVVVLGGGFIGAEVAGAARTRGLEVTMVEALAAPLSRALGVEVGGLLARAHCDNGVSVRCGVTVTEARGTDRVESVVLSDGTIIPADVVVVGLGVEPATGWLVGSGLDIDNGVLCDAHLRAVGHEAVFAVGDVARWPNPALGETVRVEHWTNANEHADVVASAITGAPRPAASVPYVWSDQYGRRIQIIGRPRGTDEVTLVEDGDAGKHVAAYERDGRLVGLMAVNSARVIAKGRRAVAAGEVSATEFLAGT
jgi:NADPH-dependent 2,4-dienoyl-CoA reductase/sulfur reductase-like enzyme